ADFGDISAQQKLFDFLSQGDPTAGGYDQALSWLRATASRDDPGARFLLGYLYEHGRGVPRDYVKAAENYEAAASQGHSSAQSNLAVLYRHGLGVPMDLAKAFRLNLAAAEQGNPIAQWNVGHFYYEGIGMPRNFAEAARWFRAAAELSDPMAQYDLGILYYRGLGVSLDYTEAARWILSAAKQGNVHAQSTLGYLYETGKGVPLDYVAAYTWYSRAIARGDRTASERCKSLSHLMTHKQRNVPFRCLALGFFLYAPGVDSIQTPISLPTVPSNAIPFQLGNDFLIIVEGQIGPLKPLKFILDTGATRTMVDARIADKLSLPRRKGKVLNFDKDIKVDWTNLPELHLGPLVRRDLPVMVGDLKRISEFAEDVDAILGLDLLRTAESIRIDYLSHLVSIKDRAHGLVSSLDGNALTVLVPLQGRPARLIVDTGLQGLLLYKDRLPRHLPPLESGGTFAQAHAGRFNGQTAILSGIRLGPDELQSSVLLHPRPQPRFPLASTAILERIFCMRRWSNSTSYRRRSDGNNDLAVCL